MEEKLGYFGQIHPTAAKKIKLYQQILYLFEFNFKFIQDELKKKSSIFLIKNIQHTLKLVKIYHFLLIKICPSFNYLQKILYLNGSHFLKRQ